jgi:hypothetical protein
VHLAYAGLVVCNREGAELRRRFGVAERQARLGLAGQLSMMPMSTTSVPSVCSGAAI